MCEIISRKIIGNYREISSRSVFSKNFVAVELRKPEKKFNKSIYVGMCILDVSKICLCGFHYEYMFPLYCDKCNYVHRHRQYIECEGVYETIKHDITRFEHTSTYPVNNAYGVSR